MGLAWAGQPDSLYNKEICCPVRQQAFTVLQATEGCADVGKRGERRLREHGQEVRDRDKGKWERGD